MKHNINIFQDDYKKLASSQTSFWVTSRGCVSLFSEEDTKWLISNYPKPLLLQMEKKKNISAEPPFSLTSNESVFLL